MSRNGSGTYSLPAGNPVVSGTTISSTWANNTLSDIATALTASIAKDGQTVPTANLPMGSFKLTGLGAGSADGNSVRFEQLFSQGSPTDIASAATTDIGAIRTNFLTVTGTTTITSFGTNYNGPKMLKFTGALLLTYNATTLVLPTAANITTAAGDTCIAIPKSTASGTADGWQIIAYQRASGAPLNTGGFAQAGANSDITSLTGVTSYAGSLAFRGYLAGLTMSTAGASTTMTVAAGVAMDSANVYLMQLAASIGKTTSSWVVGTGNGGLDTGAIANSTWYHFYLIRRTDTGVVDVIFSTSASSPTMPTNYTQYRRIGSGRTNGSGQWTLFQQVGDEFIWDAAVIDADVVNPGTSAVSRTLTVPTGVSLDALLFVGGYYASNAFTILVSPLSVSDQAPQAIGTAALSGFSSSSAMNSVAGWNFSPLTVRVNTSAQVRTRISSSGASDRLGLITRGWIDSRGRDA